MGFLDNAKEKLTEAVDKGGNKIGEGLEKAGQVISEKTGGKFDGQIDTGVEKAKDGLDSLDGQNDDIN